MRIFISYSLIYVSIWHMHPETSTGSFSIGYATEKKCVQAIT